MYAEKLKELGVTLPAAPGKGGLYAPTKTFGENKLMYVSGCGCNIPGEESFGKLGQEYTTEQGQKWARNAHDERAGCAGARPWVAGPHLQL